MFRYSKKDTFLILFTFFTLAIPFLVAIALPQFSLWWFVIGFFHVWIIVTHKNTALHHHGHWSTFNNRKLNQFYEIFLSMAAGNSNCDFKLNHLQHHIYVNDIPENGKTKDPVSVFQFSENGKIVNAWYHCVMAGTVDQFIEYVRIFRFKKTYSKIKELSFKIKYEHFAFNAFTILVFIASPYYGIFFLLTYMVAHIVNNFNDYGEHWGALDRRGDTTQDSVGIYGKLYNTLAFNSGYHQEHHHKPGVHWTKLPTITPLLHPNRVIVGGTHISNSPYWQHLKLLIKTRSIYVE
jgi:fatty acid desaturase